MTGLSRGGPEEPAGSNNEQGATGLPVTDGMGLARVFGIAGSVRSALYSASGGNKPVKQSLIRCERLTIRQASESITMTVPDRATDRGRLMQVGNTHHTRTVDVTTTSYDIPIKPRDIEPHPFYSHHLSTPTQQCSEPQLQGQPSLVASSPHASCMLPLSLGRQ